MRLLSNKATGFFIPSGQVYYIYMPERFNPPPNPANSSESFEDEPGGSGFAEIKNLYQDAPQHLEARLQTSTSKTEQKWLKQAAEEAREMSHFLGIVDKSVQQGSNLDWRGRLAVWSTKDEMWKKKIEEAGNKGDYEKADKLTFRFQTLKKFANWTPQQVKNYFSQEVTMKMPESHKSPVPTKEESRDAGLETLINQIYEKGRVHINTSVGREVAQSHNIPGAGFNDIADKRNENEITTFFTGISNNPEQDFESGDIKLFLRNQDINAAVTIRPLTKTVPIYENPPATKGGIGRLFKGEQKPVRTGEKEELVTMRSFTNNPSDSEQAYRITYVVTGSKGQEYQDYSGRTGNQFIGSIMLPRSLAQQAFSQIEKDPILVRSMFRRFEPDVMQEQEQYMPNKNKTFVLPEGVGENAYDIEGGQVKAIKPEYVKKVS